MTTGIKLLLGGAILVACTVYMAFLGASTSWKYYLHVDECLDAAASLEDSPLRVNGRIAEGSLNIAADRGQALFRLEGQRGTLAVNCQGSLPDNLKEGIDVVVEGHLDGTHTLIGERVLTKCASKYQSPGTTEPTQMAETPNRGDTL